MIVLSASWFFRDIYFLSLIITFPSIVWILNNFSNNFIFGKQRQIYYLSLILFFLNLSLFIYFGRCRDSACGERTERRERIPSRLRAASSEHDVGLELTKNCKTMIWAETKSQMLNQLSHPGAPWFWFLSSPCIQTPCYVILQSFPSEVVCVYLYFDFGLNHELALS